MQIKEAALLRGKYQKEWLLIHPWVKIIKYFNCSMLTQLVNIYLDCLNQEIKIKSIMWIKLALIFNHTGEDAVHMADAASTHMELDVWASRC